MFETIKPHPYYPDNPAKQVKLEEAITHGLIIRELLEDNKAKYTLTQQGELVWEVESIHNDFFR